MIPKHIIEKAIAGGWKPTPPIGDRIVLIHQRRFGIVTAQKMYECFIALDPDFWMALGKEMGWKEVYIGKCEECGYVRYRDKPYHGYECSKNEDFNPAQPPLEYAHRFYDLILHKASQEEITSFWKSL